MSGKLELQFSQITTVGEILEWGYRSDIFHEHTKCQDDLDRCVHRPGAIDLESQDFFSFISKGKPRHQTIDLIQNTKASLVFVPTGFIGNLLWGLKPNILVETENPRYAFIKCCLRFFPEENLIYQRQDIKEQIYRMVYLFERVTVGEGSVVYPGCVIGGPGFGYDDGPENFPHYGGVKIGKNVVIHHGTVIDRGTMQNTVIGDYARIDANCHIAHNVQIGERVKIASQSVIGGSTIIGDGAYLGSGVVVRDNVRIGAGSFVGIGSVVTKNVPEGITVMGTAPAREMSEAKMILAWMTRQE